MIDCQPWENITTNKYYDLRNNILRNSRLQIEHYSVKIHWANMPISLTSALRRPPCWTPNTALQASKAYQRLNINEMHINIACLFAAWISTAFWMRNLHNWRVLGCPDIKTWKSIWSAAQTNTTRVKTRHRALPMKWVCITKLIAQGVNIEFYAFCINTHQL